ncbi:hypothetical protein ACFQYP_20035 [Nonomuraea antimicrobica]
MATRINRGLSRQIAALVARRVDQVAEDVAQGARHNAPAAKTWITDADEQVRPHTPRRMGRPFPPTWISGSRPWSTCARVAASASSR